MCTCATPAQMPVVGARQRGGGGREDDVVAVAVEAGEARRALRPARARRAARSQGLSQPHLRARSCSAPKRASQVPRCGVPIVTTWCTRASPAGPARPASAAPPGRPCCAPRSPAAGRCSAPVAARPAPGWRRSRRCEPNTGSRLTATKGTPWACSRRSHGFHTPRLQTKPCTSNRPRRPCAAAGRWSGQRRLRKGWRQQNTRGAARTSPHQARSSCAGVARGVGSSPCARRSSANSSASTSA